VVVVAFLVDGPERARIVCADMAAVSQATAVHRDVLREILTDFLVEAEQLLEFDTPHVRRRLVDGLGRKGIHWQIWARDRQRGHIWHRRLPRRGQLKDHWCAEGTPIAEIQRVVGIARRLESDDAEHDEDLVVILLPRPRHEGQAHLTRMVPIAECPQPTPGGAAALAGQRVLGGPERV